MANCVIVREATRADIADIERVVVAAYSPYVARIGRAPAPMSVDYAALVTNTDRTWVLTIDTAVLGMLVTVPEHDHLLIENLAVSPAVHGRGHGGTLLRHAERIACTHGRSQTRLYTNAAMTENLAMYPRLGYVEVERRCVDGFDRVFFVKKLQCPQ